MSSRRFLGLCFAVLKDCRVEFARWRILVVVVDFIKIIMTLLEASETTDLPHLANPALPHASSRSHSCLNRSWAR